MTSKSLMTRVATLAIAGAALCATPTLAQSTAPAQAEPQVEAQTQAQATTAEAPANAVSLTGKIAAAGEAPGTFTLEVGEAPSVKSIAVDASAATSDGQPFAIGDEVTVVGTLSADQSALKASSLAKSDTAESTTDSTATPAEPAPKADPKTEKMPKPATK